MTEQSYDFTQKLILDHSLLGRVISQANTIEQIINAYIAEFYTRCPNAEYQAVYLAFMSDVMNQRGISLDSKTKILSKIYERSLGTQSKLNQSLFERWLKIRNKLAHGVYIGGKGILYGGEFFDVNELADKHAKLQLKVYAELERMAELRGPYFSQTPTKEWEDQESTTPAPSEIPSEQVKALDLSIHNARLLITSRGATGK